MVTLPIDALLIIENQKCQGHYGFHSFPVVDRFCLFIYLRVLTFPLEDCQEFGNFVITLINHKNFKKCQKCQRFDKISKFSKISTFFKILTFKNFMISKFSKKFQNFHKIYKFQKKNLLLKYSLLYNKRVVIRTSYQPPYQPGA